MMARRALWLLKRLPWEVYPAGAGVAVVVTLWAGAASYGASEYARGRKSVTASAEAVPASVAVARGADSTAKAATDTIVRRLTVTRWKVDTLVRLVPDSLRAVPEIAALMTATTTLTAQVDTLTRTLDVERATSRLRASVDSAALVSAQMVIVSHTDTIMALKKRPQWRTVALGIVGGVVVGLLR